MAFFSVSSTICLVLLAVVTAMPDRDSVDRRDTDTVKTVIKTVTASTRKCTADELTAGCTEAPNDIGPDRKLCTCIKGRVRGDTDTVKTVITSSEWLNMMPDRSSEERVRRDTDTVKTVIKTVTASVRKCTAEELKEGCTEAPNDFGPDKKSCTCSEGRVRRAPDAEEEAKTTVEERECTHEEMFDKHCTLVADIGQPLRCKCPV
ncbi:unnamed protein product, partial [Mesorhabditis belari]|uniref:Uncharacterized protein n=1 Tax=Mesorhabditis belari TaxID=2138241 RepID=A0AAF3EII3_9BILA